MESPTESAVRTERAGRAGRSGARSSGQRDFKRLEEAVAVLVNRHREAQREIAQLRGLLAERESELRDRDERIRDLNQRQQDVAKRLDEMIAQLDELDGEFEHAPAVAE